MSSLKYWIWLTTLPEMTPVLAGKLLRQFGGPEELFFAPPEVLDALDAPVRALVGKRDLSQAERVLERCDALYITPLTIQDAAYPERLRNIHTPPPVLYCKGRLPVIDEEAALGVVGTRSCTPYGLSVTRKLCYKLARAGLLIVSGMAKGIDAEANRAALDAGASTVAVLGCGADVVYPAENTELYRDICASGAVVTEYPPGTRALAEHFPMRNRILAGLSRGVLVVEGSRRSGALITARHALEQGRDIFAVPGPIDSQNSEAPNSLIREGAALVSSPEHILDEYAPLFPSKIHHSRMAEKPPQRTKSPVSAASVKKEREPEKEPETRDITAAIASYTPLQQKILLFCAGSARHVDSIANGCGEDTSEVSTQLTMLEIEGLLTQLPGKRFILNMEALS